MLIVNLKKVWLLALFLSIIAICTMMFSERKLQQSLHGNLIFSGINGDITSIHKIIIKHPTQTITAYNDNNFWRIQEADNYYADFNLIQDVLGAIKNAKLKNISQPEIEQKLEWSEVTLFGIQGNQLDKIFVSNAPLLQSHYIKLSRDNHIYLSNWQQQLPQDVISWTRQPLFYFSGLDVSKFDVADKSIFRNYEGSSFYDNQTKLPYRKIDYISVFDIFSDFRYNQVLSSQKFDNSKFSHVQSQIITTFDGLVTHLQYYTNYQEYWLKISLSTTTLPSVKINDYIQNNNVFYENWWFRLSPEEGRRLFMFNL